MSAPSTRPDSNRKPADAGGADDKRDADRRFAVGLARAFGGAIVFSLPILMTQEMWSLGYTIPPWRLAALIALLIPLLVPLSHYIGFEDSFDLKEDLLDAFVAVAVGATASAVVLWLFAVIEPGMPLDEIIGKVALQTVPGSIGALLAQSELGGQAREKREQRETESGYFGELFIMLVGALFLSFNVAPTEEIVLISYQMSEWHAVALAVVSLVVMHAFVYTVEFHGQAQVAPGTSPFSVFLRFTVVGYAIVLLVSLFLLWAFGRTDGSSTLHVVKATMVLGFPGAIGAAAARLLL